MTQDDIRRLIARAAQEGATKLDLAGYNLTELPPEIGNLTKLKKLTLGKILRGNKLKTLPPEIGKLCNLTELHLRGNQLTKPAPRNWPIEKTGPA
jgi:Leucine-rich repeat (LRR) protein